MGGDAFGAAAVTLAGVAARLLGWRPDEFWNATPADFAAALGGWRDAAGDGVDAAALGAMMEQFPDG